MECIMMEHINTPRTIRKTLTYPSPTSNAIIRINPTIELHAVKLPLLEDKQRILKEAKLKKSISD